VNIGSNIAIAWNGSAEAAHAVGEARSFLADARKVTILTAAEPDRGQCDMEGLRRLLRWHGVAAKTKKVPSQGNIGKALASAAEECGANLFVMGAYSHNRVRELIFGGVTRHMLESATLPILMMH
jgi:nucleotide-binding universal stress UspA family protein